MRSNQPASTLTSSEKVTVTLASRGAFVPFTAGSVVWTWGPTSAIAEVRRGFGVPVAKSALLTSVSVAPPSLRRIAAVALGAGALAVPSRQFALPP